MLWRSPPTRRTRGVGVPDTPLDATPTLTPGTFATSAHPQRRRRAALLGAGMLLLWRGYCRTPDAAPSHVGTATIPGGRRIVVSLKTIPSRIRYIEPTLTSLLAQQTLPLDELYLVLPRTRWILRKGEKINYELPGFLQALTQTEPRLTILRPKYDYGPVDKILYALERESGPSTHLIYLDDDVLYHPDLVRLLVSKSREYPASVVALSGCTLRSNFRQIRHGLPRARYDVPPYLYYPLSATASLPHDETVDIVQGFAGVLVRPAFFDLPAFVALVQNVTPDHDIWKADDFIISAHLASRNITRRLVAGTAVTRIHWKAATVDNVSSTMHRQVLQAAVALQRRLGIWSGHAFVDYLALDDYWKDLLDCEAGHALQCERAAAVDSEIMMTQKLATWLLDKKFVLPPPP